MGTVDVVVGDLSFISLDLVLDALVGVTREDGDLALMVKPQFEVGKDKVGKGGVVRDLDLRASAVAGVAAAAARRGWGARAVTTSPLPGPVGQRRVLPVAAQGAGHAWTRRRSPRRYGAPPTWGPPVRGWGRDRTAETQDVRRVLVIAHTGREDARDVAGQLCRSLHAHGIALRLLEDEADRAGAGPARRRDRQGDGGGRAWAASSRW